MRFMIIVKATKDSEADVLPSQELMAEMGKFNEELVKAGLLLAAEGLQSSSKGARVRFSGDKRSVTKGPFGDPKQLIAGFWIWRVKSLDEAIEWVKRCPNPMPGESEIEIRQVRGGRFRARVDSGAEGAGEEGRGADGVERGQEGVGTGKTTTKSNRTRLPLRN